jgi:RNA polymerase sigma-70 factor, ECF subfamily
MDAPSDSILLLRRIKAGDQGAVDALFRRYSRRLLSLVHFHLNPRVRGKVEAMDVLQEAFLRALRHLDKVRLDSREALMRWFSVIIRNKIQNMEDHFRADKRNALAEVCLEPPASSQGGAGLLDDVPGCDRTPSQILSFREDLARLERALDRLTPAEKELILLRKMEGLPFNDLGRRLGKTPDAVRMTFSRAMIRLSILLKER